MAEEHGELSENCAEAQHQYKHTPLVQSCMEGKVFEHPMSGFELGDSKEPKVEVENTDSLAEVPEETDPQDLREEAQGLTTIINAR